MNKGLTFVLIFFGAVALLALVAFGWYKSGYNKAIEKDERVESSWAQVENQLQRRNDLIPNLVSTVKGYAQQEENIFTEVARLRSQWGKAQSRDEKIETAGQISGALSRLLLVAENYPELKSNQNFLALQSQIEGTENRIAVERRRYNIAVEDFNRFRRSFFGRFFVSAAGLEEPAEYFRAAPESTSVPQVSF